MQKRLICLLAALAFSVFVLFSPFRSVYASIYFPPGWPWSAFEADGFDPRSMSAYIDQYRSEHPDSSFLEAYNSYRNSDYNGHHGGGASGGHRDSDVFDKLFHYNEVTKYSDDFQGTQTDDEYISYDSRVRIECRKDYPKATQIHYAFYIYVDGVNPLRNDAFFFEDTCYYDNSGTHGSGCYWKVKGTVLYSNIHQYAWRPNSSGSNTYSYGTSLHSYDFKSFITFSSDNSNNYYTVTDNSGQSWNYDPVSNYYYNNAGDVYEYIDLDISQFPEDDFNKFMDELKNLDYNSAFQFLSLYDLLNKILSAIDGIEPGGEIDLSKIKIDIPLNDYTSLLQAIQASLIVISQNMGSLASHADMVDVITYLKLLHDDQANAESYAYKLSQIISRLDTLIALETIEVTADVLDNVTDSESALISAYTDFILTLSNLLPQAVLNEVISNMLSLIYSNSAPADVSFTYQGKSYILLSTSFFGNSTTIIDTAKALIGVIILFIWLLRMRSKISNIF